MLRRDEIAEPSCTTSSRAVRGEAFGHGLVVERHEIPRFGRESRPEGGHCDRRPTTRIDLLVKIAVPLDTFTKARYVYAN